MTLTKTQIGYMTVLEEGPALQLKKEPPWLRELRNENLIITVGRTIHLLPAGRSALRDAKERKE